MRTTGERLTRGRMLRASQNETKVTHLKLELAYHQTRATDMSDLDQRATHLAVIVTLHFHHLNFSGRLSNKEITIKISIAFFSIHEYLF